MFIVKFGRWFCFGDLVDFLYKKPSKSRGKAIKFIFGSISDVGTLYTRKHFNILFFV